MSARDNRRFTGPEKCTPIQVLKPATSNFFLMECGQRRDKRSSTDIREIYMGLSNISQAKGSSYVEVGNTKVICGVYGPREMPPSNSFKLTGQVCCEVKLAPFSSRVRRSPLPDRQVKELSTQLQETLGAAIILDQYPKAQIDVYLAVVEVGGGLLAACVNAATLALCDASIHLYDVVVAASLVWHEGITYLDPSLAEEECVARAGEMTRQCTENNSSNEKTGGDQLQQYNNNNSNSTNVVSNGGLTVGFMPLYANSQVALMVMSGSVTAEHLQDGLDSALESCRKVYAVMKQVLLNNAKKDDSKTETE